MTKLTNEEEIALQEFDQRLSDQMAKNTSDVLSDFADSGLSANDIIILKKYTNPLNDFGLGLTDAGLKLKHYGGGQIRESDLKLDQEQGFPIASGRSREQQKKFQLEKKKSKKERNQNITYTKL